MNEIIYNNKSFIIYQSNKYNEGKAKPPFHNDKKMIKVILEILDNSDIFIETGSFMGKTIFFVGKNFPKLNCYSCEISKNSYTFKNSFSSAVILFLSILLFNLLNISIHDETTVLRFNLFS